MCNSSKDNASILFIQTSISLATSNFLNFFKAWILHRYVLVKYLRILVFDTYLVLICEANASCFSQFRFAGSVLTEDWLIFILFLQVKPALPALASLIQSNDEEVLTDACWALSYLSDGTNDKIQGVIEAGVCSRLVELLLWVLWMQIWMCRNIRIVKF